ncbi:hypothetical protein T265_15323, partial [Opisthorchis viverrini]
MMTRSATHHGIRISPNIQSTVTSKRISLQNFVAFKPCTVMCRISSSQTKYQGFNVIQGQPAGHKLRFDCGASCFRNNHGSENLGPFDLHRKNNTWQEPSPVSPVEHVPTSIRYVFDVPAPSGLCGLDLYPQTQDDVVPVHTNTQTAHRQCRSTQPVAVHTHKQFLHSECSSREMKSQNLWNRNNVSDRSEVTSQIPEGQHYAISSGQAFSAMLGQTPSCSSSTTEPSLKGLSYGIHLVTQNPEDSNQFLPYVGSWISTSEVTDSKKLVDQWQIEQIQPTQTNETGFTQNDSQFGGKMMTRSATHHGIRISPNIQSTVTSEGISLQNFVAFKPCTVMCRISSSQTKYQGFNVIQGQPAGHKLRFDCGASCFRNNHGSENLGPFDLHRKNNTWQEPSPVSPVEHVPTSIRYVFDVPAPSGLCGLDLYPQTQDDVVPVHTNTQTAHRQCRSTQPVAVHTHKQFLHSECSSREMKSQNLWNRNNVSDRSEVTSQIPEGQHYAISSGQAFSAMLGQTPSCSSSTTEPSLKGLSYGIHLVTQNPEDSNQFLPYVGSWISTSEVTDSKKLVDQWQIEQIQPTQTNETGFTQNDSQFGGKMMTRSATHHGIRISPNIQSTVTSEGISLQNFVAFKPCTVMCRISSSQTKYQGFNVIQGQPAGHKLRFDCGASCFRNNHGSENLGPFDLHRKNNTWQEPSPVSPVEHVPTSIRYVFDVPAPSGLCGLDLYPQTQDDVVPVHTNTQTAHRQCRSTQPVAVHTHKQFLHSECSSREMKSQNLWNRNNVSDRSEVTSQIPEGQHYAISSGQ